MYRASRPEVDPDCGVFRGRLALDAGIVTARQLRSTRYRRLMRDVYVDARVEVDHGVLILAAALVIPPSAAVAGLSSAWLYGCPELVGPHDPVEIVVPVAERFERIGGVRIRVVDDLPDSAVDRRARPPRTTPLRTAVDLARFARGLPEAVVRLDRLLSAGVVSADRLARATAAVPRGRGSAQARVAAGLADARAESPPESRVRVGLVTRGVTGFVPQFVVTHEGRFVARVDLGDPARRIAVEYDGRWHRDPQQFDRDRRRLNDLAAAGWEVVFVTAPDLADLGEVARRVLAAQHRRDRVATSPRRDR